MQLESSKTAARSQKYRRVCSAQRLPLHTVHKMHTVRKMHPTDNYAARKLKAGKLVGCAPRTDYHCIRCIRRTLPITMQLESSKTATRSRKYRRVRSAHRLPLLTVHTVHKMHPSDNYSARKLKKPQLEAKNTVGCAPRTDYHFLRCTLPINMQLEN
jgi:hypothetical protein